ncbi:uncharacterized protein [Linepithema humile]|uniref:uncharacterized protein n=1 Tax=Linepithema humile TaxID=83485 RepID=UPI00351E9802
MLMSMMTSSESFEAFTNQPLTRLAGVYFENLGDLLIFRDHWKFISYVNLAPLEEKEKILKFYAEKIEILCYSRYHMYGNNITCSGLQELERIKRRLITLKTERETINDMVGRFDDEIRFNNRGARVKRGVFDFVGQISKILFGTLDSSDANYYNEQIDLVYNNSKQLTELYKKQISIMRSTINQFSLAFAENKHKFEEIDFNLYKLNDEIYKNTGKLNALQLNTETNSYLLECAELMLEYELDLTILTDAILLARRGLLHPKILTPRELFNNLKDSHYMTNNKRLPVTLDPSQLNNLIDASDLSIFYKNHRLVYIFEIPLIEQNDFILYHMIPLPIKQNEENVYAFINPLHSYIGLRTDKQLYTHLTDRDITKCKKINDAMICKQTDLLYQISTVHTCESELLKSARLENILKECDIRVMKIHNTVWYQLQSANSWLYTAPREETLHILCKDDKPRQTQLLLTGLVKLSPECDAISDNVLLHTQTISIIDTIDKDFIPNVNLSTNKLCEDIKESNVNISELQLLNIGKTPHLDINLLKTASSSLDELYKEANEIGKHHRTKTLYEKTLSWFYYILYTMIGLVIIYITVKCSLISKFVHIFKLCCIPKEGCVQYFNNCFNNNITTRSAHPTATQREVTFISVPTDSEESLRIEREGHGTNNEIRRSRSRNNRLSRLERV